MIYLTRPVSMASSFRCICNISKELGYEPSHCLEVAYNVIKDRKITLKNGTLVKE